MAGNPRTMVLLVLSLVIAVGCSDSSGPDVGPPSQIEALGGLDQTRQVTLANQTLPQALLVRVTDAAGNPVPGTTVNWSVTSGGGTIDPTTSTTNKEGGALAFWTIAPVVGPQTVQVSLPGGPSAGFTATGLPGPANLLVIVSGNGQQAPRGSVVADSLKVRVTDALGNGVAAAAVTWTVVSGGGSRSPTSMATNAEGLSMTQVTLGPNPGTNQFRATNATRTQTFTVTGN